MNNKPKPDDRRDNVDNIQFNIDNTIKNFNLAEEAINETDNEKIKKELEEKNQRRLNSLSNMKEEIKDEAHAKARGYK